MLCFYLCGVFRLNTISLFSIILVLFLSFLLTECQSGPITCPSAVCGEVTVTNTEGPLLLSTEGPVPLAQPLSTQPFVECVYNALNCQENDYAALFALCLLYALGKNKGKMM